MSKLIAFSGTHGTGKSSCAYELATKMKHRGYSVVVCDELARECPLTINQGAGSLTQYWIIGAQMKREIKLMTKYDYVISDRTVFDTVAYGTYLGVISPSWGEALSDYVKTSYESIFVLDPFEFDYHISDGIRDMDIDFRFNIHQCIVDLYIAHKINYTFIKDRDVLYDIIDTNFMGD